MALSINVSPRDCRLLWRRGADKLTGDAPGRRNMAFSPRWRRGWNGFLRPAAWLPKHCAVSLPCGTRRLTASRVFSTTWHPCFGLLLAVRGRDRKNGDFADGMTAISAAGDACETSRCGTVAGWQRAALHLACVSGCSRLANRVGTAGDISMALRNGMVRGRVFVGGAGVRQVRGGDVVVLHTPRCALSAPLPLPHQRRLCWLAHSLGASRNGIFCICSLCAWRRCIAFWR